MNYRNRPLLNLANGQSCQLCGAQDGTIVSAHSNQKRRDKMEEFNWAQGKIDTLTNTKRDERHEVQRFLDRLNRAERRELERQERRAAKKAAKVKV